MNVVGYIHVLILYNIYVHCLTVYIILRALHVYNCQLHSFWYNPNITQAKITHYIFVSSLVPLSEAIKVKTPHHHASPETWAINYKTPPYLVWITPNKLKNNPRIEHLHYFIIKFKIQFLPA